MYIAARAPDAGENYTALAKKFPTPPASSGLIKGPDGYAQLSEEAFLQDFAQDVDPIRARTLYAVQGRISGELFSGKVTQAAWRNKPTFYAVSKNDRTINPDLERFMAKRMNATTIELDASHLSMVSKPARSPTSSCRPQMHSHASAWTLLTKRRSIMKHAHLGTLDVARIGLGAMGMSRGYSGAGSDDAESIRTIQHAIELGVTLIDTAEMYGPYTNEQLVGRALKGRREIVVLATKFGIISHTGRPERSLDSSPDNIRAAVEGSLRRPRHRPHRPVLPAPR